MASCHLVPLRRTVLREGVPSGGPSDRPAGVFLVQPGGTPRRVKTHYGKRGRVSYPMGAGDAASVGWRGRATLGAVTTSVTHLNRLPLGRAVRI